MPGSGASAWLAKRTGQVSAARSSLPPGEAAIQHPPVHVPPLALSPLSTAANDCSANLLGGKNKSERRLLFQLLPLSSRRRSQGLCTHARPTSSSPMKARAGVQGSPRML